MQSSNDMNKKTVCKTSSNSKPSFPVHLNIVHVSRHDDLENHVNSTSDTKSASSFHKDKVFEKQFANFDSKVPQNNGDKNVKVTNSLQKIACKQEINWKNFSKNNDYIQILSHIRGGGVEMKNKLKQVHSNVLPQH